MEQQTMKRQLKRSILAGSIGLAAATSFVRCSPITSSVSKIVNHSLSENGGADPSTHDENATPNEFLLKTYIIDGDDILNGADFRSKLRQLAKGPDSIVLAKKRLEELIAKGSTEIPALDEKSAREAEVYLKYDLERDEIVDAGVDRVQAVLKSAGEQRWVLSTKPSKNDSAAADVALKHLEKIMIVFKNDAPVTSSATIRPEVYSATDPDEPASL